MVNSALFDNIDPDLELDVPVGDILFGAHIATKYILDTSGDFVNLPNWGTKRVPVLEFAINLMDSCSSHSQHVSAAGLLAHGLLERIAQSAYLFFADNFDVFARFSYSIVPLLDGADETGRSDRVNAILKALKNADYERTELQSFQIEGLYISLARSNLYHEHALIPAIPESELRAKLLLE